LAFVGSNDAFVLLFISALFALLTLERFFYKFQKKKARRRRRIEDDVHAIS